MVCVRSNGGPRKESPRASGTVESERRLTNNDVRPRPCGDRRRGAKWLALAAIAALAVSAASAQYPGGGTGGARGSMGGMGGPSKRMQDGTHNRSSADAPVSLTGQIQFQLGRLEDELKLTVPQQASFRAYSDRVLKLADDIARARFVSRSPETSDTTALQQFDRLADVARNRMTAVEDIVDAGKVLYASLSPQQRTIADRRLAMIALQLAGSGTAPPMAGTEDSPPGSR